MRAVTDQVWKKKTTKNIPEHLAVFSGVFVRGVPGVFKELGPGQYKLPGCPDVQLCLA